MLESGWVDESRQNQVCNLPDMSHHRYNNLLWSDLVNVASWALTGQILKMGCFHLGHVPGPVTRVAEIGAGPTCEKGGFLKLLWNIFLLQTINMVIVHAQVYWGTALILMWIWILHVLCGLLSRMQCNLFYADCESRRWAVLMNASWVDKPFRLTQYNEDLWDSHAS